MDVKEINDENIEKVIEDMVNISYTVKQNAPHFGSLDFKMALEIMKVAELKRMNELLDKIDTRLYHMGD